MILHWLAGYSLMRLFTIACGMFFCIVMAFHLVRGQTGKIQVPLPLALLGILWGACLAVFSLLRRKAYWDDVGTVIGGVGDITLIGWSILMLRHYIGQRNKPATPIEPFVSSDKIWPPAPTSQGKR